LCLFIPVLALTQSFVILFERDLKESAMVVDFGLVKVGRLRRLLSSDAVSWLAYNY